MEDGEKKDMELVARALDALPDPALPPGLYTRVLSLRPDAGPQRWTLVRLVRAFWPQAAGLAAASVIGFVSGVADPGLLGEPETDLTPYILALDTSAVQSYTEEVTR